MESLLIFLLLSLSISLSHTHKHTFRVHSTARACSSIDRTLLRVGVFANDCHDGDDVIFPVPSSKDDDDDDVGNNDEEEDMAVAEGEEGEEVRGITPALPLSLSVSLSVSLSLRRAKCSCENSNSSRHSNSIEENSLLYETHWSFHQI